MRNILNQIMMKWILILLMALTLPLQAAKTQKGGGKQVILVGRMVKQSSEGTLVEGRIVTSEGYLRGGPSLQPPNLLWVIGWKEADPALNASIEFLVTEKGQKEHPNAFGVKETMPEYGFVRLVTKADAPQPKPDAPQSKKPKN
jgi:hypothetical protein